MIWSQITEYVLMTLQISRTKQIHMCELPTYPFFSKQKYNTNNYVGSKIFFKNNIFRNLVQNYFSKNVFK